MRYPNVLRIYATTHKPDFDLPWQRERIKNATGSGVLIGPNLILTGAHVIHHATFIQVQRIDDADKCPARLKAICHDSDLALLELLDPAPLEGLEPAKLAPLPTPGTAVVVVGFPTGGRELSMTEGVVSRIELNRYVFSHRHLLTVTVDAAINPGNSGGPVFAGDQVVGIAFQKNTRSEGSGEMVPTPVIEVFLRGAARGEEVVEMPGLGLSTQTLENRALREHLALPEGVSGLLVTMVNHESSLDGILAPGDVISAFEDYKISNSGTIHYRDAYRTRAEVVLSEREIGDQLRVEFYREGSRHETHVELKALTHLASPSPAERPRYLIYGGLVFQPLSRLYLETWSKNKAPSWLTTRYIFGPRREEHQDLLVISHILSDQVNVGYEQLQFQLIKSLNGEPIVSLDAFATRL
ncbi:MAG: trypsin-like peptidase domain-containing protein, partial [Myxococcota bacterium]|nr:trypsin-like peptidase domain-containing protein [Myxococcota bacterium]